jgi:hypothetical protein
VQIRTIAGNDGEGFIYASAYEGGSGDYVATVSAQKDSVIATAITGGDPWGLACFEPSGLVYAASALSDKVYVLSADGARVLKTLQVGDGPFVFAVVLPHNRLYLGHEGGRHVYVLRDTSAGIMEPQSPRPELRVARVTPNPFSQRVAVVWHSPARGGDVARVYAQDGRLVRQARIPSGQNRWVWDGRDDSGALLPPGVYVIEAGSGIRAKVVKLRWMSVHPSTAGRF